MARPRIVRLNKAGDLRGMRSTGGTRNTGKKKCPICGKFFSTEEINDHVKVHSTEDVMNGELAPLRTSRVIATENEEKLLRSEAQVHALRSILLSMNDVVHQLLDLERRF